MKSLREIYNSLCDNIYDTYNNLIEIKDYDLIKPTILEYYDSRAEEIFEEIDSEGLSYVIREWDLTEVFLTVWYYNHSRGVERQAYLLGASKKDGLFVFDEDLWDTTFINFSDLNVELSKIEVIEELLNLC